MENAKSLAFTRWKCEYPIIFHRNAEGTHSTEYLKKSEHFGNLNIAIAHFDVEGTLSIW